MDVNEAPRVTQVLFLKKMCFWSEVLAHWQHREGRASV